MKKKYQLFNFYFISIIWINFCITFSFYLSTVVTTGYAIAKLNSNESLAGLASGIFIIGTMLARFLIGRSLDTLNLKRWLLGALVSYAIITLLYFICVEFWILLITRFLHGFSFGVCSSICGAIVARMIPSFQRGVGIGYYALGIVLASAIAPFLAIYLLKNGAYEISFSLILIIMALAISPTFIIRVREIKKGIVLQIPKGTQKNNFICKISEFFEPTVKHISLIICLVAFCFGGILSFIGEYATERNLVQAGSLFFIVYALTSLFGRPIAGKIFDCRGHNVILISAIVFFFIALILIAFAQDSWVLLLAAVFVGLGYGNFFSSGQSYAIKVAPKEKTGLATSSYYMSLDFGMGIGPFFLGMIAHAYGYKSMFIVSAIIVLVALGLYWNLIAKDSIKKS